MNEIKKFKMHNFTQMPNLLSALFYTLELDKEMYTLQSHSLLKIHNWKKKV
jgi:hypothetical protein